VSHEDEVLMSAPPYDEVIRASIPPAQEEEDLVSHFPFQNFDDALFHVLKNEEVLEEPLDALALHVIIKMTIWLTTLMTLYMLEDINGT